MLGLKLIYVSKRDHREHWDVIIHQCCNFNDDFVKLPLKLGHGWVITSHVKLWIWLQQHQPCNKAIWDILHGCIQYYHIRNTLSNKNAPINKYQPFSYHPLSWWRHQMETFSALLAICAGNSPVPGEFPHKGQWRGALMFSLICVWINGWVNNRKAGDLRRYRAHYDVIVMICTLLNHIELPALLNHIITWLCGFWWEITLLLP